MHHLTAELLRKAYDALKRNAGAGVDDVTWQEYGEGVEGRITDLHDRVQSGRYRAKPSKRVWIPKPDGRQRPIGIAALEDKIVQQGVVWVLNQIYEKEFHGFSYGFRPDRSPHNALDAIWVGITQRKVNWVLDADIKSFLETSSYCTPFHERLSKRVVWIPNTLIYKPFRFPERTWTAVSSPRFTRCNTVWRETPRSLVASSIDTWPSGTS